MSSIAASGLIDHHKTYVRPSAVAAAGFDEVTPIVFIVDGERSVRQSLERLVRTAGWDAESFASAEDFLAEPRGALPCCVILDLALPGLSGLDLQQQLAGRPDMPLIFLTRHTDVPKAVQAMKAGAVEFLIGPWNELALVGIIDAAIDRSRAALRRSLEVQAMRTCYATLTRRERDVMRLVVAGLLNKQVGGELGINEVTVKAHRGQVMRKMQAASLPDLVTKAMRLQVLT